MELINLNKRTVEISPNPFDSYTIITVPEEADKPYSLELFDQNGEKLLTQVNIISNKFILGRNNLPKGTYFFKIYNPDYSFLDTGKIVVN